MIKTTLRLVLSRLWAQERFQRPSLRALIYLAPSSGSGAWSL